MKTVLTTLSLTLFLATTLMLGTAFASGTGETVYKKSCASCHNTGVMDAPKLGDEAVWADLMKKGTDSLTENAIKGIGKMPPKGGFMSLTDAEMKAAVDYMIEESE